MAMMASTLTIDTDTAVRANGGSGTKVKVNSQTFPTWNSSVSVAQHKKPHKPATSFLSTDWRVTPPPPDSNSPVSCQHTLDTAETAEITVDTPSQEKSRNRANDSFGCWLESQEFDASAIVAQNEEDEQHFQELQNLNVSGIIDDFPIEISPDSSKRSNSIIAIAMEDTEHTRSNVTQSWWSNPNIEALWKQILSPETHCYCLCGPWLPAGNHDHDEIIDQNDSNTHGESYNLHLPTTSYLAHSDQNQYVSFSHSPYQSKSDFSFSEASSFVCKPILSSQCTETCKNTDTADPKWSSKITSPATFPEKLPRDTSIHQVDSKMPAITQSVSEHSMQSALTPLLGEQLLENSLTPQRSLASSTLVCDRVSGLPMTNNSRSCFPQKKTPQEIQLAATKLVKNSLETLATRKKNAVQKYNSSEEMYELSMSKSQEERIPLRYKSKEEKLKWLKERRRRCRNDCVQF